MHDLETGLVRNNARHQIGLYLPDTFNLLPVASALEPLRIANRVAKSALYQWRTITDTGDPVQASNGMLHQAEVGIGDASEFDLLIIAGPFFAKDITNPELFEWLRQEHRKNKLIVGLETGCHALAKAGILDSKRCTTHWEIRDEFQSSWPGHELSSDIYEQDGQVFTCSGGVAPLDMMLFILENTHGHELAASVADCMIHPHIRNAGEPQRMDLQSRIGVTHPVILECVQLIESNIEQPLTPDELSDLLKISKRQLERLFLRYLNTSPARYYLTLHLEAARNLLETTSMKIIDIALATGFKSAGHFSNRYQSSYGITPREARARSINPTGGVTDAVRQPAG